MAKFNHAAKWDRREQSRKAREAANSVRMDHFDLYGMRPVIVAKSDHREMGLPFGWVTEGLIRSFGVFVGKLSARVGVVSETAEERAAREIRLQRHIDNARLENLRGLAFDKISKGEFDEELLTSLFDPEQVERLRVQAGQITTIRDQISATFGTDLPAVITTVGVYPNGPSATNGVALEDLPYHIWYNASYRPGRGLIVNGKIWFTGGGVDTEKLESERMKYSDLIHEYSTVPYH